MAGHCEVGILFADIAGSTRIYEMLGDARAHAIVTDCLRATAAIVASHGGIVVKTIGDELMAAFQQPVSMYTAAVSIQRKITQMEGPNILRLKGIIALKDDPDRYVLQGVHMLIEGDHQRAWKDGEKHESRLVFIGRDLSEERLRKSFEACQAA